MNKACETSERIRTPVENRRKIRETRRRPVWFGVFQTSRAEHAHAKPTVPAERFVRDTRSACDVGRQVRDSLLCKCQTCHVRRHEKSLGAYQAKSKHYLRKISTSQRNHGRRSTRVYPLLASFIFSSFYFSLNFSKRNARFYFFNYRNHFIILYAVWA